MVIAVVACNHAGSNGNSCGDTPGNDPGKINDGSGRPGEEPVMGPVGSMVRMWESRSGSSWDPPAVTGNSAQPIGEQILQIDPFGDIILAYEMNAEDILVVSRLTMRMEKTALTQRTNCQMASVRVASWIGSAGSCWQ